MFLMVDDSSNTHTWCGSCATLCRLQWGHLKAVLLANRPMVELLFARLPPTMRVRAISRLARFVTTNTLPSVTQEAAILCNAAGWADPPAAATQLLAPLLEQLEAELPALERSSMSSSTVTEVSKVGAEFHAELQCDPQETTGATPCLCCRAMHD